MSKYLTCSIIFYLTMIGPTAWSQIKKNEPMVILNHIALHVNKLDISTRFYENILQLKQIPEPFKDGLHTWFAIGGNAQLHLIEGAAELKIYNKYNHLCFSVEDFGDFVANLEAHQIDYTNWPGDAKTPTVRADGVKQVYFKDPDGHWIEVNDDRAD